MGDVECRKKNREKEGRERCGESMGKVDVLFGKLLGMLNFVYIWDLLLCTDLC